jgi:hypothetical protein
MKFFEYELEDALATTAFPYKSFIKNNRHHNNIFKKKKRFEIYDNHKNIFVFCILMNE